MGTGQLSGGALLSGVALFTIFALIRGVCYSAGSIAWNLGHLHFAHPEDADVYMGIHVSLTGLRGLIMPTVGMVLWHGIGSWEGIGTWVWVISIGFSAIALGVYVMLARSDAESQPGAVAGCS